jgi:glycosyltransferase involved in cell wall biosynthesis
MQEPHVRPTTVLHAPPAEAPLVSVVIPNHNYGRFLAGCLRSLFAQELDPGRVEVVFVDDESGDGSLELAHRHLSAMPFAGARVLALPRVGRPGPVRNAGLELAAGRYLLTLDPDDELLPGFLARCVEALEAGADVAYADYLLEEGGCTSVVRLPDYHRLLLANQNILSTTALFRRALWEAGARFRSATAYEDWDFWVQLAQAGARFAHVPVPLYRYRMHGANYSHAARSDDALAKARIVLDNPGFFPSWTLAWARGVEGRAGWADPLPRGLIPVLPQHTGSCFSSEA